MPRLIPRGAPHGAWQMGGAENLRAEPETFGAVLDPVCVCLLYLILGRQFLEESGDDVLCAPVCQTLTAGASHTSPPCSIPARERQPPRFMETGAESQDHGSGRDLSIIGPGPKAPLCGSSL